MTNNVVDFKRHQQQAQHRKKEAGIQKIHQQFEAALPVEKAAKEKLLAMYKKKSNTRTPKKKK